MVTNHPPVVYKNQEIPIVQRITKNVMVAADGKVIILWNTKNETPTVQILPDLESAIRQTGHVLENYLGSCIALGDDIIKLPGEIQMLQIMAGDLHQIIESIILFRSGEEDETNQIDEKLQCIFYNFRRASNQYKQAVSDLVQTKADKIQKASALHEATGNIIKRIGEILDICSGVWCRRKALLAERRRIKNNIKYVYEQIVKMVQKVAEKAATTEDLEKFALDFREGKRGLWPGLATIHANPWRQRVQSREVKRLLKLVACLSPDNQVRYWQILVGALAKLKPAVEEFERLGPQPPIKTTVPIPKFRKRG